jgi:hypothetical protein
MDMGSPKQLAGVLLFNRQDCCSGAHQALIAEHRK